MYMDDSEFWAIVHQSADDRQDNQERKLKAALSELNGDEVAAFDMTYRRKHKLAHHWDLWAAAYIINGGCSDDGFDYFKDWLISRGQSVFDAALSDPETLIGIATPWETDFEGFGYVATDVMEEKNTEPPALPPELLYSAPAGEEWDEDDVEAKYPKLAAWVNGGSSPSGPAPSGSGSKPGFWQRLFGKK